MMDMKQFLIFGLLIVPMCMCKKQCFDEGKVNRTAEKKLRNHYPQPPEPLRVVAPNPNAPCPVELFKQAGESISNRSLSPWRYEYVTKKDHYPSTYVEARCLCKGCIVLQDGSPVENNDYNSVPIMQSRVFLKRELCENKNKYRLKPVSIDVAVGCTCARTKISSS